LKSKNTMLLNTIDSLENKLEKFSSDNLKSMLCIHSNISNKLALIVDDLSTSTSHASDSDLGSIDIKHVIVDTACLDNSCLNNHVMPKSKEFGTQGKFVPTCHNCGKIGYIRPNCYLLKFHRSWIKQDALRKGKIEESSSSKYVPTHRRHIKGKDNVICKNANLKSAETVNKHSNKRRLPTCHHWSHPIQVSTALGSQDEGLEEAANKSYIRHSTFNGTSSSTTSAEGCSC
jgi:hypothetical protein